MVAATDIQPTAQRPWFRMSSAGTLPAWYAKAAVSLYLFTLVLMIVGIPSQATAASFTGVDRGVRISLQDTLVNGTLHDLLLTLDTTGYIGTDATFLHALSLRPLSDSVTTSAVLFRDPAGAASSWTLKSGQADPYTTYWRGNGTDTGSGWFTEVFNGIAGFGTGIKGGMYLFRWRVDSKTTTPVTPPDFKAIFVDNSGQFVDQTGITLSPTSTTTSSPTTGLFAPAVTPQSPATSLFAPAVTPPPAALPEPSTIVGLGIFATAIGLVHWRHRRQKALHAK